MKITLTLISLFFITLTQAQLIKSVRPWLGIAIDTGKNGVLIKQALDNTPAKKAGLKSGDEVLSIDGKSVTSPQELISVVANKGVGYTVKVSFLRDGKKLAKKITLVAKPELEKIAKSKLLNKKAPGFNLDVIHGGDSKKYDLEKNNKIVLLEFWSTSCPACISAHPKLAEFSKKNIGKVDVVSVSADKKMYLKKYIKAVEKIKGKMPKNMIFLHSKDGKENADYMANAIPTFVLINKEGVVVDLGIGAGEVLDRVLVNATNLSRP